MAFVPDKDILKSLKGLLSDVHIGNNEVQKKVTQVVFQAQE